MEIFTLKILIVDDELGMRIGVERAMRDFCVEISGVGCEVRFDISQASSAEEAVEIIEGDKPDIMLLDYKLPGMTGLDLLDTIEVDKAGILTIMITAYASLETAVVAIKRGAFDFLAKPFTPSELKSVIRKSAEHIVLQRQALKLAEEKKQIRFQFISVLAHELKSPLGAIEGYLHIMSDKVLGGDIDAYQRIIGRSLYRIKAMRKQILDLLDLTRIESGKMKRNIELIDIIEIVEQCIEDVEQQARERGICIEFKADGRIEIEADRCELTMILNNLITNAVKYNRDGGRVAVVISDGNDDVVIEVSDTGIGIEEEQLERIFEDFVRIKNDRTKGIAGSGLGLSIVKKLVHMYEGRIAVDSKVGEGTRFTVILPKKSKLGRTEDEQKEAGQERNIKVAKA